MFQNIKDLISTLWLEKDKKKARDISINLANQLLLVMGAPKKNIKTLKDIYNAALPPSYFNNQKIESWFEKHPFFNGPVALKLYDDKNSAFESSFFHLSDTATKARIAATTLLGINWEDLEIYELPKYKVGIDFFLNFESNSLLMIVSRRGNVRVVEFCERLTHTQEEILGKLSESNGILSFEGIDLKTGQQLPREPQKTIHEVLWRELQVSEVNKKFYTGIADYFEQLTQSLLNTNQLSDKKHAQIFSSRLIGRVLFIWFLKKMNLINKKIGYFDTENIISSKYYEVKLKPLFFEVLNTPIDSRNFDDKTTPFLNGGLFEPNSTDFYDKKIIFPNLFFTNFYKHLNDFNFTVDESTPEYEQVAIDPEMLGRVFENLLASIVPETSEAASERTNKGAFYTPREIVSYMCKESLKEFLRSKLDDQTLDEGIFKLIDLNDANFIELKSTGLSNLWGIRTKVIEPKIINILNEIKIFDPACGSGAFPIGMLQLISRTYDRLNANFDTIEKKHIHMSGKSYFNRYESKLSIIRNNLYGSDIEPMAIEIARLRIWLTLIIEEKAKIYPLPNLDFNFVCSNTLVKLDENIDIFEDKFIEDFKTLRDGYFQIHSKKNKQNLKDQFNNLYNSFIESSGGSRAAKLKSWNPFDISKPSAFFDPETMFNIKKFDIVIANPPYIHFESIRELSKTLYKNLNYKTYEARGDIYTLFYERGIELLSEKAILCYITSNKWMRADYGESLRNYFIESSQPIKIIDMGSGVFDSATVDTNIIVLKKDKYRNEFGALTYNSDEALSISEQFKKRALYIKFKINTSWTILGKVQKSIKDKVEKKGIPIGELESIKINRGLLTGFNEAFLLDEDSRKEILQNCKNKEEIELTERLIKPVIRGKDIKVNQIEWNNFYIILAVFGTHKFIPTKYPAVYNHLKKYEKQLKDRGQCRYKSNGETNNPNDKNYAGYPGMHHWLELDNNVDEKSLENFIGEKIFFPAIMSQGPFFAYSKDPYFILAPGNIITGSNLVGLTLFLQTIGYYCLRKFYMGGGIEGELKVNRIQLLPIPNILSNSTSISDIYSFYDLNKEEINEIESFLSNFNSK